jgi:hypothetical protein
MRVLVCFCCFCCFCCGCADDEYAEYDEFGCCWLLLAAAAVAVCAHV